MDSFVYTASPSRVVFGPGTRKKLPDELARKNLHAALILCTKSQKTNAQELSDSLGKDAVGIFDEAAMHTPIAITEKALQITHDLQADSIVSIGGGSTIGLGKAISIRTGLPHITIATTYAGSEMTSILGETVSGLKTTRKDPKILPDTVIYDVDLTLTLPPNLSATSGINALAHAAEALYAPDTNPIIRLLAQEGIRSLASSLPILVKTPQDESARSKALYGAWLCGLCLGNTSMSLHHKLCHALGGTFNLPHAETHTILLPHTIAYNSSAAPEAMRLLAEALGRDDGDAVGGLNRLLDGLGVKRALRDFGLKEEDIPRGVEVATKNSYGNPRVVERDSLMKLIRRAWAGEPAATDL